MAGSAIGTLLGRGLLALRSEVEIPWGEVNTMLVAESVLTLIGLLLAYQAYLGYRRHDERSMLYVAVGLLLTLSSRGIGVAVTVLAASVLGWPYPVAFLRGFTVGEGLMLLGILALAYALYPRGDDGG